MKTQPVLPGGLYPVMLTPLGDDGLLDWHALDALIEWYLEAGAAGLFAVCLSSEMYELSEEERFGLAAHVVARARGRVPVVASGTFGGPIERQAATVCRMAETGVGAVVVIPCQLVSPDEGETLLRDRLEQLMAQTESVPLGLYECPSPYHRVLSPELLSWAAGSGRFLYHKDTQADLPPILAKLGAIRNTRLGFFDASTPTALDSLLAGAAGVSPIGANYYPALYAWMCRHFADRTAEARELQRMLAVMEGVASRLYPVSAKWYLQQLGLPMGTRCRISSVGLNYHDQAMLHALRETAQRLCEDLP